MVCRGRAFGDTTEKARNVWKTCSANLNLKMQHPQIRTAQIQRNPPRKSRAIPPHFAFARIVAAVAKRRDRGRPNSVSLLSGLVLRGLFEDQLTDGKSHRTLAQRSSRAR